MQMHRRCFVGFFGITRALDWTIESIEQNIFRPLADAGIEQVRAAHFNKPEFIRAPRSNEPQTPFKLGDIGRLGLHKEVIEPQTDANIAAYLPHVMSVPMKGEEDPGGATRRNALHQLYSLQGLSRLFKSMDPASFDMAMILRPDLRYLDRFPAEQFLAQIKRPLAQSATLAEQAMGLLHRRFRRPADIVTPAWQKWGGLNDRFAIATPAAAIAYMNRIDSLADFCASRPYFQPEHLLAFALERTGLTTADTWVRAERVRSNGSVEGRDTFRRRDRLRWYFNV